MKDDKYLLILAGYTKSVFQDFESYLGKNVDSVKGDIKLVLDEYNQSFITYELTPGIYTFKDLSDPFLKILQPEYEGHHNSIVIKFDDITRRTIFVVRPGYIAIKFDEKLFFSTILGFNPFWVYKHYNNCISQKIVNLSVTNKIHLNCDVIDGSVVNGLRQPILYRFALDKPPDYKILS